MDYLKKVLAVAKSLRVIIVMVVMVLIGLLMLKNIVHEDIWKVMNKQYKVQDQKDNFIFDAEKN